MSEVVFRSDLPVELVDWMGSDETVVRSARVSTGNDDKELTEARKSGLINYLVKNGHVSPLEHCFATFRIEAPIFVAREMVTHKGSGLHWNEISGRYAKLKPEFYVPGEDRPLVQEGTGAHPKLGFGDRPGFMRSAVEYSMAVVSEESWGEYEDLIELGVANEVARNVLPVGVYTSWYASATLREWLHILELRLAENAQWEIRVVSEQILASLRDLYPVTIDAWQSTHVSV